MSKRLLYLTAVLSGLAAPTAPARAADLHAQLFPLTGEIRLLNMDSADLQFVFYSIASESGALDSTNGVWTPIANNYDVASGATPGNGFIDPNGEWLILPSDSTMLAEGALDSDGGRLPAWRAISLGHVWNPYATPIPDLIIEVWNKFDQIPIAVDLALDGDFSQDYVVDLVDYVVWRRAMDSTTSPIVDANLNGIVDEADYMIWYANFGLEMPWPPYGGGGGSASDAVSGVPEPSTTVLISLALGSLSLFDTRRGTRRPRRS